MSSARKRINRSFYTAPILAAAALLLCSEFRANAQISANANVPSIASMGVITQPTEPAVRINQVSARCENAQIALGTDGWVFAVWEGQTADSVIRNIWFAERSPEGVWSREIALSAGLPGASSEPSISVDPRGYPHVVWCSRIGLTHHVFYSRRRGSPHPFIGAAGSAATANYWSKPQQLDVTDELNCQTVSITFDNSGRPAVIWQAGMGTMYRIYAAFAPHRGKWRVDLLGTNDQADYCSFPQLVPGPRSLAVWYEAENNGLKMRAAFAPESAEGPWTPATLSFASDLPADRLVNTLRDRDGRLWAMWTDARNGLGERVWLTPGVDDNAILIARRPALADDQGLAFNRYPSADAGACDLAVKPNDPGAIALSWVVEANGEKRIAARMINPEKASSAAPSRILSDPSDSHVASPCIREAAAGVAHVVWNSSFSSGGSGNVFHAIASF